MQPGLHHLANTLPIKQLIVRMAEENRAFGVSAWQDIVAHIEGIAVRTLGGILMILGGLAWEFSAKLHIFVDQVTIQKWQAWLAAHTTLINQIAPLALIGGGVFWIVFLHARPVTAPLASAEPSRNRL